VKTENDGGKMRLRQVRRKLKNLDNLEKVLTRAYTREVKFENRGNARELQEALEKIERDREYYDDVEKSLLEKRKRKTVVT
jgi:hypothetical protein